MTQGYRKVPGNICTGGIDLEPYRYQCSTAGYIASFFTFRGIFIMGVLGALAYYGWPLIEAVLLVLPIPDPADLKDKVKGAAGKASSFAQGVMKGDGQRAAGGSKGY